MPKPKAQCTAADIVGLRRVIDGYAHFQALYSACELDLFGYLSRRPGRSSREIAKKLGLSQQAARILLIACHDSRLLTKDAAGRHSNAPIAETCLVRGAAKSMLDLIKANHEIQYQPFHKLLDALREDTNAGLRAISGGGDTLYERLSHHPEMERLFQRQVEAASRRSNAELVKLAAFGKRRALVDIGGGHGLNALMLNSVHPELRVTVFDLPTVCQIADRNIAAAKRKKGVTTWAGDFFRDPFPPGMDSVLFSHLLEIFSLDDVRFLLKKAFAALPARGLVVILAITAKDDETGGSIAAKSSLYFHCLASGKGMAYPVKDYKEILSSIGFSKIKVKRGLPAERSLISAEK